MCVCVHSFICPLTGSTHWRDHIADEARDLSLFWAIVSRSCTGRSVHSVMVTNVMVPAALQDIVKDSLQQSIMPGHMAKPDQHTPPDCCR